MDDVTVRSLKKRVGLNLKFILLFIFKTIFGHIATVVL